MKQFIRKIWDKIVALLCKVPYDKWLHAVVGMLVAAFFGIVLHMKPCIIPVVILGVLKEVFDAWTTDSRDWWDLGATCIGGALIQIMILFA